MARGFNNPFWPCKTTDPQRLPFFLASAFAAILSSLRPTDFVWSRALSRSGKNILHVDRDECYGGSEAALSLQDADEWVTKHKGPGTNSVFAAAEVKKSDDGLSSSRAYSLALAPQLIHTRSDLLAKLVSSKAFRQLEFLAVGSFYVYQQAADAESKPTLNRIPSTREDVFVNKVISMKSKRGLMKFLKFVLDYKAEEQLNVWTPHKDAPLSEFLASEFKLDEMLQSYIVTLTMSLDGKVSVEDGLNAISRHLTSMGVFGPGFAAVYPKWGGLSEVAQVGCRGGAVGGAIYILGTGVDKVENTEDDQPLSVTLTNDLTVKTKSFIQESAEVDGDATTLSRLTAIVDSTLSNLFEVLVEGAPTPSASVVAFPAGSLCSADGNPSSAPIYAMLHSGDTGECPSSQCKLHPFFYPLQYPSVFMMNQRIRILIYIV